MYVVLPLYNMAAAASLPVAGRMAVGQFTAARVVVKGEVQVAGQPVVRKVVKAL